MDAFSLASSLGTLHLSNRISFLLSITVGAFHFFMPILGSLLGNLFISYLRINVNLLSSVIFLYISIQMFKEIRGTNESKIGLSVFDIFLFALGVSLDSFGVGFTIDINKVIYSSIVFSTLSLTFTFLGLKLGKFLNEVVGSFSIVFGLIIMCCFTIVNFVKFCTFN